MVITVLSSFKPSDAATTRTSDRPFSAPLRLHDQECQAIERFAMIGPERLICCGVAMVHSSNLSGSAQVEANQVAVLQPSGADRLLHALHLCSGCQIEEMAMNLICRGRSSPGTHRICPFRIMWTAS